MQGRSANTFSKEERICSKLQLDRLFHGRSSSMAAYPIRAVFCCDEAVAEGAKVKIMVSVPKKCFKRAVKRNRVKRQIREAYRLNKQRLVSSFESSEGVLLVAFIWLDNKLWPSSEVEKKMVNLINRISEKMEESRQ